MHAASKRSTYCHVTNLGLHPQALLLNLALTTGYSIYDLTTSSVPSLLSPLAETQWAVAHHKCQGDVAFVVS
jgi:hypothetical protein